MIWAFLQLIRVPGIFTVFSNILIGYFYYQNSHANLFDLSLLFSASGLLFMAGMMLNDVFDYNVDKKERPQRPLPSGKIQKTHALYGGIIFLVLANSLSFFVSVDSFAISIIMTVLLVGYNYKIKSVSVLGIFILSLIRFLNVLLGFSLFPIHVDVLPFSIPVAILVAGISILAKEEIFKKTNKLLINQVFIVATILYLSILSFSFTIHSILFLIIFSTFTILPTIIPTAKKNLHRIITIQLLSITLLDAYLISLISEDASDGIVAVILFIPGYLITRKLYLT